MAARSHARDRHAEAPRFHAADAASIAIAPRRPRSARLLALVAGSLVLLVNLCTLAPSVTGEDSGEFITAAWFFGVPHPPGYPLWTLMCGAFIHLFDVGCIAWRANLFSALCAAGAVTLLAWTLTRMGLRPIYASAASVIAGLTESVWSQSVITEVYTLNLLIMAGLLAGVVQWRLSRSTRWLIAASLLFGLGMSNHHILGFAALGMVVWAVWQSPQLLRDYRLASTCVLAFAVGLLPYLYLLWAARREVPVRWGETTTLTALWDHAARRQYRGGEPGNDQGLMTATLFAGRFYYGLRWEVRQFTPLLLPLLAAGVLWLWRRRGLRQWLFLAACITLCSGPLFLYVGGPKLDRQDEFVQKVFLTPLALISAVPLAGGLQWLGAALRRFVTRIRTTRFATFSRLRRSAAAFICLPAISVPLVWHWRDVDMRHYWWAYDHAQAMLACMLPDAIIFPSGDHNTFPLIYLIHVEGVRPDVTIADKYGYVDLDLYRDMPNNPGKPRRPEQREAIEEWIIRTAHRPVYYTIKSPVSIEKTRCVPVGLLYHLLPEKQSLDSEACWSQLHYRNLDGPRAPLDLAASNILSDYYYAQGIRLAEHGDIRGAKRLFEKVIASAWGLRETFNNVASALAEYGQSEAAIEYYESAAKMDWTYGPARWNLAKLFANSGHADWAAKIYEDLTEATPKDFRPPGELGFLWRDRLGDPRRAREWFYESLRLNPAQPQIIQALAQLDHPQAIAATSAPASPEADRPPDTATAAGLQLDQERVDFGRVVQGRAVQRSLLLTNSGSQPYCVPRVERSCGCVVGSQPDTPLTPGDSTTVTVGLNTAGKLGPVRESFTLYSDDPLRPELKIELQAVVVAALSIEPTRIERDQLPGEPVEPVSVQLQHNGGEPFEITGVGGLPTELQLGWARGRAAPTHTLTLSGSTWANGELAATAVIHTDLAEAATIDLPIAIKQRLPLRAEPALVYLGRIGRDQALRRSIALQPVRNNLKSEVRSVDIEPAGGLVATMRRAGQDAWEITLETAPGQLASGPLKRTLRVRIADCDTALEIPVHGFVAE